MYTRNMTQPSARLQPLLGEEIRGFCWERNADRVSGDYQKPRKEGSLVFHRQEAWESRAGCQTVSNVLGYFRDTVLTVSF